MGEESVVSKTSGYVASMAQRSEKLSQQKTKKPVILLQSDSKYVRIGSSSICSIFFQNNYHSKRPKVKFNNCNFQKETSEK